MYLSLINSGDFFSIYFNTKIIQRGKFNFKQALSKQVYLFFSFFFLILKILEMIFFLFLIKILIYFKAHSLYSTRPISGNKGISANCARMKYFICYEIAEEYFDAKKYLHAKE